MKLTTVKEIYKEREISGQRGYSRRMGTKRTRFQDFWIYRAS